jgi:hypothetical protein
MVARKALKIYEVSRDLCPSAGGFAIEEVFKTQFLIHQIEGKSLKQAFSFCSDFPSWIADESLQFSFDRSDPNMLLLAAVMESQSLVRFRLVNTPASYGPDLFLIFKSKAGLWYCISGAIKLYRDTINKALQVKNWAAANPGLMFRKCADPSKKSKLSIESFVFLNNKSQKESRQFHECTEHAFNWYDPQFNPNKLGGAIICCPRSLFNLKGWRCLIIRECGLSILTRKMCLISFKIQL